EVLNPRSGERAPLEAVGKRWTVGEVFDRIVEEAWRTGEPGLVFIDRVNRTNPTPALGPIEGTNPRREQPPPPYESRNPGSLNLSAFVAAGARGPSFDEEAYARAIRASVHFLDDVVEVNRYPLAEISRVSRGNRKIGLGLMGFADALFRLGLPYDSE